jgi:hypothetical protein
VATNWQEPAFAIFPPPDKQGAGVCIVITDLQLSNFGAPYAAGVEEFKNTSISQAERTADIGQLKQFVNFGRRKGFRQGAGLPPRKIQVGRRICRKNAVAA